MILSPTLGAQHTNMNRLASKSRSSSSSRMSAHKNRPQIIGSLEWRSTLKSISTNVSKSVLMNKEKRGSFTTVTQLATNVTAARKRGPNGRNERSPRTYLTDILFSPGTPSVCSTIARPPPPPDRLPSLPSESSTTSITESLDARGRDACSRSSFAFCSQI